MPRRYGNVPGRRILGPGNNTVLAWLGQKQMFSERVLGLGLEVVTGAITGTLLEEHCPASEEENQPCDENDHLIIAEAPAGPDLQLVRKDSEEDDDHTCQDQADGRHPPGRR